MILLGDADGCFEFSVATLIPQNTHLTAHAPHDLTAHTQISDHTHARVRAVSVFAAQVLRAGPGGRRALWAVGCAPLTHPAHTALGGRRARGLV